jgi:hypothetical protein
VRLRFPLVLIASAVVFAMLGTTGAGASRRLPLERMRALPVRLPLVRFPMCKRSPAQWSPKPSPEEPSRMIWP